MSREVCYDYHPDTGSPYDLLITKRRIARFMGIAVPTFSAVHQKRMMEYGLCWKHGGTRTSPIATSKYFVNVYFYLEQRRRLRFKDKRKRKLRGKTNDRPSR